MLPVHVIIVPNIFIKSLNYIQTKHVNVLGHMIIVSKKIAFQEKICSTGYRLVINCNDDAGQEVFYLHMHILGGKKLGLLM